MWLLRSSIGRKFVMALTGVCLVLFITFHVLMNAVALIWPAAYNSVCEFLGANWYALIASCGLAALFIIHIIYAVWLTIQNRAARGSDRYAINARQPQVEWSSKNMLVLGIVILAFLAVHMIQFWAKMQLQELRSHDLTVLPVLNGAPCPPAMGTLFIQMAFSEIWTPIVYIIGFVALWFHLNHGVWSMFQSTGINGRRWLGRLKKVALWWSSIVVVLFIAQAVVFTILSHKGYYTSNPKLQEQYAEYWGERAQMLADEFNQQAQEAWQSIDPNDQEAGMRVQMEFLLNQGKDFVAQANLVDSIAAKQFPGIANEKIQQFQQFAGSIRQAVGYAEMQQQMQSQPATPATPEATAEEAEKAAVQNAEQTEAEANAGQEIESNNTNN